MEYARGRSRTSLILTIASVALAIGVALFVLVTWITSYKASQVEKLWDRTFGTREEILARFPRAEANAAALEVEAWSARLGIDTATRSYEGRAHPSLEQRRRLKGAVSGAMADYRDGILGEPRRVRRAPPPDLAVFLEAHASDLAALRRHLAEGEMPRWEMDVERLFAAPIPNLMGHIDLTKLLVTDALAALHAGDRERALEDLEAAWKLTLSLRGSPFLICQLIHVTEVRLIVGALRQVERAPAVWRQRLSGDEFHRSFLAALQYEGWHWTQVGDFAAFGGSSGVVQRVAGSLIGPYVRFCLADVSGDVHARLVNLANVRAICDRDLAAMRADLNVPIPRWNALGGLALPNLDGAVYRLARLQLDRELTLKVLELDVAGGAWPAERAGQERSVACPGDHWSYGVTSDGGTEIAFSREPSWPDLRGVRLPLRFVVGGGS